MPIPIVLYGLTSCAHCKEVRQLLQDRRIPFECIFVDLLTGEERSETLRALRRVNPEVTFPTVVVGDEVIIGFKRERLVEVLSKAGMPPAE